MYYIESGVAPLNNTHDLKPRTQQFQMRCKRKWSTLIPILLTSMELQDIPAHWNAPKRRAQEDNERKYRNCKSLCESIYRYKEHKWLSKHKFMLYSPLPLPSDILRQVFVCLHGHGP